MRNIIGLVLIAAVGVLGVLGVLLMFNKYAASNDALEEARRNVEGLNASVAECSTALVYDRSQLATEQAMARMVVDLASIPSTDAERTEMFRFLKAVVGGEISLQQEDGKIWLQLGTSDFYYAPSENGYSSGWSGIPPWTAYARQSGR